MGAVAVSLADVGGILEDAPYGLLDQSLLPVGVGTPPSMSLLAMLPKVAPRSKYQANICPTMAASYSSILRPAGPRGWSGSVRKPKGTLPHGNRCPARS